MRRADELRTGQAADAGYFVLFGMIAPGVLMLVGIVRRSLGGG